MKVDLYLLPDGLEALVKGEKLYHWHVSVRVQRETIIERPPRNSLPIALGVEVTLPSRESAVEPAKVALEVRISEVYNEAAKAAEELRERLKNLLALPAPEEPRS